VSGCGRYSRLVRHRRNGREFDHYWCFGGMPEYWAQVIETYYIHAFRPPWNENYPPMNSVIKPFLNTWRERRDADQADIE
jgi:hypothetical protein